MSDIVERLRRGHHNADLITVGGVTHDGRCLVAADEITRLRADLAAAQEREQRMREALNRIAANTCCDNCREAALVARAAMRGEP